MSHHYVRLVVLLSLLIVCGLAGMVFLTISQAPARTQPTTAPGVSLSEDHSLAVGVILAGEAGDYGWGAVTSPGVDFDETSIQGSRVTVFDNLAARSDMSLSAVIEQMALRDAQAIFISGQVQPAPDETWLRTQYPNIVFVLNLSSRASVERLLDTLPFTLPDAVWLARQDQAIPQVETSSPRDETGGSRIPGLPLLVFVVAIGVVTMLALRRMFPPSQAAGSSRSVVGRLIERVQQIEGEKPKKKRGPSSTQARALALQRAAEARKIDFTALGGPMPVLHRVVACAHGATRHDESFALELASGRFLGECGIESALPVNQHDTMQVTAFEVWLFDLQDARTASGVLASLHAMQDQVMHSKLSRRGEVLLAEPEALLALETANLRMRVRVLDTQCGFSDTLPQSSFFDYLVVEIAVWQKA